MDLSVVLATYNERENIEDMINKVDEECRKNNISTEIIVVDDNSPDGTSDIVKKMMKTKKNLRLIMRPKKEGLGAALFHGYQEANGEVIGSSDSDLSIDPKYIPKIYKEIQKGCDLVTGSRYMNESRVVGKPMYKILVSRGAAVVASLLFGMNLHDYTLNFRFFKKKVLPKKLKSTGNVLLAEFLYSAKKRRYKIHEIPIVFVERTRGKSKMRLNREISLFLIGLLKLRFIK